MRGILRHLTLPGTLAHELSHAVAGSAWCDRVAIEIHPRSGAAKARLDWRGDDPPDSVVAVTALAPAIAGLLTAVLAVGRWLQVGTPTPSTTMGWSFWSIVAMWWVAFVGNPNDIRRGVARLSGGDRDA